jgi:polygalacturonase
MIWALNTDGIDFAGNNITITNCSVTNFDDSYCAKPMLAQNSVHNLSCTSNVLISDVTQTWGVGVSMGSVPPDVGDNCISGLVARRVHFRNPLKAIYIKPNPPKAAPATGTIANILYEVRRLADVRGGCSPRCVITACAH